MLSTFVPSEGPLAGNTYYLPITNGDLSIGGSLDAASLIQNDMADGSYDTTGAGPMFTQVATWQHTMTLSHEWLKHNNNIDYTKANTVGDAAARNAAFWDFTAQVLMGGQGVLTDTCPPGSWYPPANKEIEYAWCYAKVGGSYNSLRRAGGATGQLVVNWYVTDGYIVLHAADGSDIPIMVI